MKNNIKQYFIFLFAIVFVISGCKDELDEQPRSILVPSYLESPDGIRAALVSAYSGMRFYYGTENGIATTILGTDEFTTAALGTNDEISIDSYSSTLNPANGQFQTLWNNSFIYINMCNAVIQFAPDAEDMPADEATRLIAEAKFLRAEYYFLLVRTFGGVPLDLGSGNLTFNTNPATTSLRNSVSEVYDAIIQDLKDAVQDLPAIPLKYGRAGKAVAMHVLAKAYLTRGWLDIKKSNDFSNAYTLAKDLIDNQSKYNLQLEDNFANVNKQGNEHGHEVIWTVEHTTDIIFNESGFSKSNGSHLYFYPFYYIQTVTYGGETVTPVTIDFDYQVGWVRFRPTQWLLNTCFADKVNDSRYDVTFRTLWQCNTNAGQPLFSIGDTAIYMPGIEVPDAEKALHKYLTLSPSDYTAQMYPALRKYEDSKRQTMYSFESTRPFIVYKLSETYLIAAEAALEDERPQDAVPYLNAIRERAAYRAGNTEDQNMNAKKSMIISNADVNIDLILNERSRELCGEQLRWFDLVRTNKLSERVKAYDLAGASNIKPFHVLRPIPQSQIDLMTSSDKSAYQNDGY
ncbi:MAG: RagB/SusD family nutrient uptake outer membrane protein [Bacteroidales bacterium]|nr:RagB/SusD family nutrient uptake outer membrane protein [Bacteroidales bacterium]